ncbi:hypothetical protein IZU99_02235 [Oscillospiraceae bacterium CM]|nr:hypothetical protein IZU99_02235 [Oscillospiraceae bacterium CM]
MKQFGKSAETDPVLKTALVIALYSGAALITGSGALFGVYSVMRDIRFGIMNITIPGIVIAMLMLFFGIRSFFSIRKLSRVLLQKTTQLSMGKTKTARLIHEGRQ